MQTEVWLTTGCGHSQEPDVVVGPHSGQQEAQQQEQLCLLKWIEIRNTSFC
jgi:hypothetical protein